VQNELVSSAAQARQSATRAQACQPVTSCQVTTTATLSLADWPETTTRDVAAKPSPLYD